MLLVSNFRPVPNSSRTNTAVTNNFKRSQVRYKAFNPCFKAARSELPVMPVLDVNFVVSNIDEVADFINKNFQKLRGKYIAVAGCHSLIEAYDNPEFKNILNSAALALPDGRSISLAQRKKGASQAKQILGPGIFEKLMRNKEGRQLKHFFYGSTEKTLELLKQKLPVKYPNAKIVGYYSPPFRPLTPEEDRNIIKMLKNSHADIIWVGLGSPKQERWMYAHKGKVNSLMLGIGGVFDFEAGNVKVPPAWINKLYLGWFFRMVQEPKRLFMRSLKTVTKFLWLIPKM